MVVLENPDANEHCKFISFPIIVHKIPDAEGLY